MRKSLGTLAALALALPAFASPTPIKGRLFNVRRLSGPARLAAPLDIPASGLGAEVPVVGKLTGAGNVNYYTSVDVANNTGTDLAAEFFFDATDVLTGAAISVTGNITNPGQIASALLHKYSDAHFDDFASDLVGTGGITQQEYDDGVLGSMLVVFDTGNSTFSGQGTAQARFYSNSPCAGTIGVSAKGQEITGANPQSLVGVFRDTIGIPNTPQLYPNMFLNNIGITPDGQNPGSDVTVRLTAYGSIGAGPGIQLSQRDVGPIGAGQTAVVNRVFDFMGINLNQYDTIIVFARVVNGDAAIAGLAVEVDSESTDGSSTDMSRADF